jgi:hypothetical protein
MREPAGVERIRQLREETVAAIEQRAPLADAVRRELVRLVGDGLICRDGAAEALQEWGLKPMPQVWTVLASGQLSYAPTGSGNHHAPDRLYERVLDKGAGCCQPSRSGWGGPPLRLPVRTTPNDPVVGRS